MFLLNLMVNTISIDLNMSRVSMYRVRIELMVWTQVKWGPMYEDFDFCD